MRQHLVDDGTAWRERVVLAYIDEPPFGMPGPDGQARGCDVDLAMTVLHGIGVRHIEMRLTTFAELLPGVCAGRWTINTPLFVTPRLWPGRKLWTFLGCWKNSRVVIVFTCRTSPLDAGKARLQSHGLADSLTFQFLIADFQFLLLFPWQ